MTFVISPEVQVNTNTTGAQQNSSVSKLPDGGWIVTWESAGGDGLDPAVYFQRYDAAGAVFGGEVTVSKIAGQFHSSPQVASLADGGWILTWTVLNASFQNEAYQRRYDADGLPMSAQPELVAPSMTFPKINTSVTALADGGWVVTWNSVDGTGNNDVYYRQFDASGAPAPAAVANVTTTNYQGQAVVVARPGGGWTAIWHSIDQSTNGFVLVQRSFDSAGVGSAEVRVNPASVIDETGPHIAFLQDNGWLVTWQSQSVNGTNEIYQRRFDSDGNPVPAATQVNTFVAGEQTDQSATGLTNGGWVVVWMSTDQEGADDWGVYLQEYDAAGNAVGGEVHINTSTYGTQFSPTVSPLANGGYVVTFSTDAPEDTGSPTGFAGDGFEIYQKTFNNINTAPDGVDLTITINEDVGYTFSAADFGFSDVVDGNNFAFVKIAAVDGDGTLTLDGNVIVPGSDNDMIAVGDLGGLVWTPGHNSNGAALGSISFQVVDDGGTTGGGVDTDQTPNVITFNVNPVNDAPVLVKPVTGASLLESPVDIVNFVDNGLQVAPFVTGLSDGGYVVTWASEADADGSYGIYQRLYDALGVAGGVDIQVSTTIAGDQEKPAVAAFNAGGWVVVWQSLGQDGNGHGVYFQRFDANGTALGVETLANTNIALGQYDAAVTVLANDSFVISFSSDTLDQDAGSDIYTRHFASNGAPIDAVEVLVNTTTDLWQYESVVTALPDGGYLVTWTTDSLVSITDIVQRRYDANGVALTGDIIVSTFDLAENFTPAVTVLSDGGWVTTWYANGVDGDSWGILQQAFHADGSKKGGETLVNTSATGDQKVPVVAALDNGGWVVVWQSDDLGINGLNIFQQAFFADGSLNGGEVLVNQSTGGTNAAPSVAALPGGRWSVSWESLDGGNADIFHKVYQQSENIAQALAGQLFTLDLPAAAFQDVDGDVLTYSLAMTNNDPLPAGLAIDPATGQITWTPAIGDAGQIELTVTASDGALTASDTFFLSVTLPNFAPVAGDGAASVDEDATINANVAATDVNPGETATLVYALTSAAPTGLTFNADGSYSFDASSYDNLAAGETLQVTANYKATDAQGAESGEAELVITITGTNDAPVAQDGTADVDEDATVNGTVVATDPDNGETATLTYALTSAAPTGLTFNADGSYSFDASSYDNLAAGETLQVTANYKATDAQGAESGEAELVVTITGTNDAPVAQDGTAAVDEDATVSGTVVATDPDNGETATLTYALTAAAPTGLTFNADGSYSFDASSYDNLAAGETLQVTANYKATDAQGAESGEAELAITITGTNDAPVKTGIKASLVDGVEDTVYLLNEADLLVGFTDADGDTLSVTGLTAFTAGTILNNFDGTFSLHPRANFNGQLTLSYTVTDGNGGNIATTNTVMVTPVNDAPTGPDISVNTATAGFQSQSAIAILPDGGWVVTWMSPDGGDDGIFFQAFDAFGNKVGGQTAVNTATASWQFDPSVAALAGGGWVISWTSNDPDPGQGDGIFLRRFDSNGAAIDPVDMVVKANTPFPQRESVVTALPDGGFLVTWQSETLGQIQIHQRHFDSAGNPGTEIAVEAATNQLDVSPDIAILSDGGWVVTWSRVNDALELDIFQRRFDAQGNAIDVVDVAINVNGDGLEKHTAIAALADGGWVVGWEGITSEGAPNVLLQQFDQFGVAVGVAGLAVGDVGLDAGQAFSIAGLPNGGWVVTWHAEQVSGEWNTYQKVYDNNGLVVVPAITVSSTVKHDQFQPDVASLPDGSWVVTWAGNGSGDDGSIFQKHFRLDDDGFTLVEIQTGMTGGIEDTDYLIDPAVLLAGFADIDFGDVLSITDLVADHGAIMDNGDGTFTLVPELDYDGLVRLTYTVTDSVGGEVRASNSVMLTPANDPALIFGTATADMTEDDTFDVDGDLDIDDPDAGDAAFVAVDPAALTGAFGTFTFDETTGDWSYDLDESLAVVQGLKTGDVPLADTLTVTSVDGTTQDITVTINGVDDATVISGDISGGVTEDADPDNTSGTLVFADPDNGDSGTVAETGASDNGLGTFTVDAEGNWNFVLDNENALVQALPAGATTSDSFTVTGNSGATQLVTVTITGFDDPATIGGDLGASVTEDQTSAVGGVATVTDPDSAGAAFVPVDPAALDGAFGTFTFDPATGAWTYDLDETLAVVQSLDDGEVLTDTLAVASVDGTTQDIVVTINGVNDAPATGIPYANATAVEDLPFSLALPAGAFSDIDGDVLTFSLQLASGDPLPAGLVIDPVTGTISWTPGNDDVGVHNVVVVASDGTLGANSAPFAITVVNTNDVPILLAPLADRGFAEEAGFSFAIPAESFIDIDADDILTYSASLADDTPLPAWLDFDPDNQTFTAADGMSPAGVFSIRVTATDLAGATRSDVFVLTIGNANDAPVLANAVEDQIATEDAFFSFVLPLETFADADPGDILTFAATMADGSDWPDWLSFNPANRHFTGTPANGDVGPISILVTATDLGGLSVSDVFTIDVVNVNDTPVLLAALADRQATEDTFVSFVLPLASFGDIDAGDSLTWSASLANEDDLPAWLDFDPETRTFSGTPGNGDTGVLAIRVTVTDLAGAVTSDIFNLDITNTNDDPTIGQALGDQTAFEDEAFVLQLPFDAFIDSDPGEVLSFSATRADNTPLPGWLQFDTATGLFWGKPLNGDVGNVLIKLTATDSGGATQIQQFAISVENGNDAPTLEHPLLDQVATENAAFSFVLPVNAFLDVDAGDHLAFTAELANGQALPEWLHFDAALQAFTGKPANGDVGLLAIRVTATDDDGLSASDVFNIDVVNVNNLPFVVTPLADQTATEDAPFAFVIPAGSFGDIDANDPVTLSASLASEKPLPSWLLFNPDTGTFTGTPGNQHVGTISVRVTATDTNGAKGFDVFDITIANTNDGPVAGAQLAGQTALEDADFVFNLPAGTFIDIDAGDVLSYSATLADGGALPQWLSVDAADGHFHGKPANGDVGSLSILLTATDAAGLTASQIFSLAVVNTQDTPVLANPLADQMVDEDSPFSLVVPLDMFIDPDGDNLTLTASLADGSALPSWLSFVAGTGTFSGTPDNGDIGVVSVRLSASDGKAQISQVFSITVTNTNDAPIVVTPLSDQSAIPNVEFSFAMPGGTFTDIDAGDTFTLSAMLADGSALPDWLIFDAVAGAFSGTPLVGDFGALSVTVTATDQAGASVSDSFALVVDQVNQAPLGTDGRVVADEDVAFVFSADDFGFVDLDGHHLKTIIIDSVIGNGSLTLNGKTVVAGVEIDALQIGELKFLSEQNKFGADYASFTFRVIDDGGTDNGGIDTELVDNTMIIDVADVVDTINGTRRKDRLTGTEGDDIINGKKGNDRMNGGEGSDTFLFRNGFGHDLIKKFDAVTEDHDVLNLHAVKSIKNFRDLMKHHVDQVGNKVLIDDGHHNVIVLKGVHLADLDAGDFIF